MSVARSRRKNLSRNSPHVTSTPAISPPSLFEANLKRPVLITGGAGFIGTNLANHFLTSGIPVLIYDNLSRRGSEVNLNWLAKQHGHLLRVEMGDIRDSSRVRSIVCDSSAIFHFAAQVAVTDSVIDPRTDFEVNAGGTLNVLEAVRSLSDRPPLIFTSTNKVYGAMPDLKLRKGPDGYSPVAAQTAGHGVSEARPLDFCSPYGCSKGSADQYVLDYARTYGLSNVVFRMSCIYGPHQFGTEDQGWIAHFLLRAREAETITIYGDGSQVRDVLFIDDLIQAFALALRAMPEITGRAFNIGGGASNTLNLLQLVHQITELQGGPCSVRFDDWRPGDQRYYVSNTTAFRKATGWAPTIGVRQGVECLYRWLEDYCEKDRKPLKRVAAQVELARVHRGSGQEAFARTS